MDVRVGVRARKSPHPEVLGSGGGAAGPARPGQIPPRADGCRARGDWSQGSGRL